MQKMAIESLLLSARRLAGFAFHNSLIMTLRLNKADEYSILIETHEHLFPCSVSHFLISAVESGIGSKLHTCFVPSAQRRRCLPFVTLCSGSSTLSCASVPLQLPESNIVYGESCELTTYPVGTVLFYPPSVLPARSSCTPWFIVYTPCPASLLGGAVPIGRVTVCSKVGEKPNFGPMHVGKRAKK